MLPLRSVPEGAVAATSSTTSVIAVSLLELPVITLLLSVIIPIMVPPGIISQRLDAIVVVGILAIAMCIVSIFPYSIYDNAKNSMNI